MNSLLVEAKTKVNVWLEENSIGPHKSGNLLLKFLIRYSHLCKNTTTYQIRIQWSTLDDFMATCVYEMYIFNGRVKVILDSLKTMGGTTNDILKIHLRDTPLAEINYSSS